MLAGRGADVDAVLERTAAANARGAVSVPRSFGDVAVALRADREVFEAGGVFPPLVIQRVVEGLE